VDAVFGDSWSVERAELESRGMKPVAARVQSLGIPSYDELVLIARPDRLRRDPRLASDFLSAMARGTAAAVANPKAAVEAIIEQSESELDRRAIDASVEATLPLLSRDGYIDPGQADRLAEWMHEEGMTRRALPAPELFTNEYLAPQP
ncbi:MAG TPA: ABC transporter substrate-binding protein, partial [Solirubrobacterales bacterium]|nr:ABC transporter substrate-binding protein [Solirubrobacterales bacterium]